MSKRPGLKIGERIFVGTPLGEREIQLCFGDITALPVEDKVDFILVSAFPGDYSPMRGTVIGALKYNLGINVGNLAKYKKEDLRHQFNCWISQRFKDQNLPYRQLVCFERMNSELTDAVKEIFRAMMPAFNNANKSVITPLLATGHQHADELEMMKTMVKTAARWMRLGMPLQTLKLVIYSHDPYNVHTDYMYTFKQLKSSIERVKNIPKGPEIIIDLFLIYSDEDENVAGIFIKYLKKQKRKVRIQTIKEVKFKDETWQYDLFNVLLTVARVIPIMSTRFLQQGACIDQFNVALCCNRCTSRHLLAPVLVERLILPVYMNMVQWLNCRNQTEEQFDEASSILVDQIEKASAPEKLDYDIFISYSHKNIDVAKQFLQSLDNLDPKPRCFFDYHELTTGVSWQETLYKSIDHSRCVVALLSPAYLQSAVCQEELNLALAKHLNWMRDTELIPICLEDVGQQPLFDFVQKTHLGTDVSLPELCDILSHWLATGEKQKIFSQVHDPLNLELSLAITREHTFNENYKYKDGRFEIKNSDLEKSSPMTSNDERECDVYISHSVRDQKYASFLAHYLQSQEKSLRVLDKSKVTGNEGSLIDSSKCLVVLLSPSYVNSQKEVEEFNIILSHERRAKATRLLYIIKVSELKRGPTYFSLVPCDTSFVDDFWWTFWKSQGDAWKVNKGIITAVEQKHGTIDVGHLCPLYKAASDILCMCKYGRYLPSHHHNDVILSNIVTAHIQAQDILSNGVNSESAANNQENELAGKKTQEPKDCGDQNAEISGQQSGDHEDTSKPNDAHHMNNVIDSTPSNREQSLETMVTDSEMNLIQKQASKQDESVSKITNPPCTNEELGVPETSGESKELRSDKESEKSIGDSMKQSEPSLSAQESHKSDEKQGQGENRRTSKSCHLL